MRFAEGDEKTFLLFCALHGFDFNKKFISGNSREKDLFMLAAFLYYYEKNKEKIVEEHPVVIASKWYDKQRRGENNE
jgi:hypothetical protein